MTCVECIHSKAHGRTMIYCTLFGIPLKRDYDRCKYHKKGECDAENDKGRILYIVRGEEAEQVREPEMRMDGDQV